MRFLKSFRVSLFMQKVAPQGFELPSWDELSNTYGAKSG